jgi:hypothetical protein
MQTKLAMFEYLKLQAFIMHFCMIRLRKYIRTLHNAMSLRNQEYYGHRCCDQKNIRVKDIFFWNEQYLHDNVGCCE